MNVSDRPLQMELSELAEVQLRKWAAALESRQPKKPLSTGAAAQQLVHPYVTITAEYGADYDSVVAKSLAKRFGWDYLESDLLNYIVEHYDWRSVALDYVNEESVSWFQQASGKCQQIRTATSSEYKARCGHIFLLAAHQASHVFAGSVAQFFLPRERGLTVRLVDLKKQRITAVVERHHCSPKEAARFVDDGDESEGRFVKRHFRQNVADPHLYDLIINLERTSIDTALDLILGDYMLRFEPNHVWCAFHLETDRSSQRM